MADDDRVRYDYRPPPRVPLPPADVQWTQTRGTRTTTFQLRMHPGDACMQADELPATHRCRLSLTVITAPSLEAVS